ncbi:MAG: hypothetical protein LUD72_10495 [Bacteroidales bacterium]|nr:hypothetical protein [Bacteroidales bacterium]
MYGDYWSDIEDEISSDYGLFGNHNIEDRGGFNGMRALSPFANIRRIGRSMRGTGRDSLEALLAYDEDGVRESVARFITEAIVRRIKQA